MKDKKPLRFIILCDSLQFPAWQARCVREAVASGLAVSVGIVVNAGHQNTTDVPSKWRKRWRDKKYAIWRMFNRFYVNRFSQATIEEDLNDYFSDVPKFFDQPVKVGNFSESLSADCIRFVGDSRPDFILRFGFGILKGDVLKAAPYGVWSYHHGDPTMFRGQPPGFWEIFTGSTVTGTILQVLGNELDAGNVLHRGFFQTTLHSYAKTRDSIYIGCSSWVRRTCAAIQENGWPIEDRVSMPSNGPIWKQPDNLQMLKFLIKTAQNFVRTQITYRLFRQNWNIGIISAPIDVVAGLAGQDQQEKALKSAHWMSCNSRWFAADPFGYQSDSTSGVRVFFELFNWKLDRGVIAAVDYDGHKFGELATVLETGTHLSYPYVLRDEADTYFIPEHSAARNISAFHVDAKDDGGHKIAIFPETGLLDATIFKWKEKFWLFGLDESSSQNSDLHIFYGETWQGPWQAHPLNPVKTDIRNARPGGTPFIYEGKLYRPAQDCSSHYGSAVVINEIMILDSNDFVERPVARVQPTSQSDYQYGLHTLSAAGKYTLIDGARKSMRR